MYEKLIKKANQYFEKAMKTKNLELKLFYLSASKGYEEKALNLTIGEA